MNSRLGMLPSRCRRSVARFAKDPPVIRIDGVSKRHGHQILFLEASAAVNRGEKIGLVGPNGAGKTTLFRLLTREEEADDGQVAVERGNTIGYFSQDIGEMKGMSVVEAALDGAGPVCDAARALHALERQLGDPAHAGEMDALIERFGEAQARFESLGGYGLDARARAVLAGLVLAEREFDSEPELHAAAAPTFAAVEVTDDVAFTGGALAVASPGAVVAHAAALLARLR